MESRFGYKPLRSIRKSTGGKVDLYVGSVVFVEYYCFCFSSPQPDESGDSSTIMKSRDSTGNCSLKLSDIDATRLNELTPHKRYLYQCGKRKENILRKLKKKYDRNKQLLNKHLQGYFPQLYGKLMRSTAGFLLRSDGEY